MWPWEKKKEDLKSFEYTLEEKELLDEARKYIGTTPFLLQTSVSKLIKKQKDYQQSS